MKHTAKFLCMALSLVMLFAMSVPAMAEGTINKLEYTLNEGFDEFDVDKTGMTVRTENGNSFLEIKGATAGNSNALLVTGDSTKAISSAYYEAGFKIKLDNSASKDFLVQVVGSNPSYPVLNSKFTSGSAGKYLYQTNDKKSLIDSDTLSTGDWNDIKLSFSENHSTNEVTLNVYLNGEHITELVYTFNNINSRNRDPYQFKIYPYDDNSEGVYIDDMYIASYETVADFDRNPTVKVVKGQNAVLPATINGAAVTWGAIDEETNTATGLLDGYAVDVRATATIQEIDMPYTAAVSDGNLTITKETNYAPAAKIYGATYSGGKLTAVNEIGTITADEAWNGSTKTVSMGNHTKAFIWDSALTPLANIAE